MTRMANNISNEKRSMSRSTIKLNGIAILALLLVQLGTTPVRAVVDHDPDHGHDLPDLGIFQCIIDIGVCFTQCVVKALPTPDPVDFLKCNFDCGNKLKCKCDCGKGGSAGPVSGPNPPGFSPPKPPSPNPSPKPLTEPSSCGIY